MCVINISLNPTTPVGTTISTRNGRYRKVGTTTWINFSITSNSYALNVNDLGQYELQVNITNSLGTTSAWASSTFSVTTTCGGSGGGTTITECVNYEIAANSGSVLSASYLDCDGILRTFSIDGGDSGPVCAIRGSVAIERGSGEIFDNGSCGGTTTPIATPITTNFI